MHTELCLYPKLKQVFNSIKLCIRNTFFVCESGQYKILSILLCFYHEILQMRDGVKLCIRIILCVLKSSWYKMVHIILNIYPEISSQIP